MTDLKPVLLTRGVEREVVVYVGRAVAVCVLKGLATDQLLEVDREKHVVSQLVELTAASTHRVGYQVRRP